MYRVNSKQCRCGKRRTPAAKKLQAQRIDEQHAESVSNEVCHVKLPWIKVRCCIVQHVGKSDQWTVETA